jgi:hypothetical protein
LDFLKWSGMKVVIHDKPALLIPWYPIFEVDSINAHFSHLRCFLHSQAYFGYWQEWSTANYQAFKLWRAGYLSAVREKKLEDAHYRPKTLDFRNLQITADKFLFEIEDDPIETACLLKRWCTLSKDLHRHEQASASIFKLFPANTFSSIPDHLFDLGGYAPISDHQEIFKLLRRLKDAKAPLLSVIEVDKLQLSLTEDRDLRYFSQMVQFIRSVDSSSVQPFFDSFPIDEAAARKAVRHFNKLTLKQFKLGGERFQFLLRDYPQPLLSASSLLIYGPFCLAQTNCPSQALGWFDVSLGPFTQRIETGGAVPAKIFQNLQIKISDMAVSYGYCLEGTLEMLSRAIGRLSLDVNPGTDQFNPAQPLKWWDKLRFKIHGPMNLEAVGFNIRLLTTPSPYVLSFLELGSQSVAVKIETFKFSFSFKDCKLSIIRNLPKGNKFHPVGFKKYALLCEYSDFNRVDVLLNYDLRIDVNLEWVNNYHPTVEPSFHYVFDVDEKQLAENLSSKDVFKDFRAVSLGMSLEMVFTPLSRDSKVQLWWNDLSWLWSFIFEVLSNPPSTSKAVPMQRDMSLKLLPSPKRWGMSTGDLFENVTNV